MSDSDEKNTDKKVEKLKFKGKPEMKDDITKMLSLKKKEKDNK